MNIVWKIINIEWIQNLNGNEKVAKNVHFWVEATDEDGHMGYTWGSVQLDVEDLEEFVPYAELTEAKVISWVQQALINMQEPNAVTGLTLVSELENQAITMCEEQDPLRVRGIGVPW